MARLWLALGVIVMFGPVLWLVLSSFKTQSALQEFPPSLLPMGQKQITVQGYDKPLPVFLVPMPDGSLPHVRLLQTRGEFGGLGIEVTMEEGLIKVVAPIEDTPAWRAGVKAGDQVSSIDGESMLERPLTDTVQRLRGTIGTPLTLIVLRDGKELTFQLKRDRIIPTSVMYERRGNVAWIHLTGFNVGTDDTLHRAIDRARSEIGSELAGIMRQMRSNLLDTLRAEYVTAASAKGLPEVLVIYKHALRNAILPVVSLGAVLLGFLLGGSVIVESVFALNGIGLLAFDSIKRIDFPVVQSILVFLSFCYILLTLLSDIINAYLDPRISL